MARGIDLRTSCTTQYARVMEWVVTGRKLDTRGVYQRGLREHVRGVVLECPPLGASGTVKKDEIARTGEQA